jgi:outer membrane immunogenic protein
MMKKLSLAVLTAAALVSAPAFAADMRMPAKAPPPIMAPIFTWTGFYLGGNIGAAWTSNVVRESFFGNEWGRTSEARFIGGGQIGYNWQFNQFVLGIEGDIDGIVNKSRTSNAIFIPAIGSTIAVNGNGGGNWISTIAGRFGFAVDRTLFYGKAGYGWVNGSGTVTVANLTTGASYSIGGDGTRSGWLVGGGIEYALNNNWTLKGEFDYLGLNHGRSFVVPAGNFLAGDTFTTRGRNVSMVKFGFNYLFR